jgi:arylsulfatase
MYEHSGYFDPAGLYECNIRIPLVIRGPRVLAGQRICGMAQQIDLAPTVLAHFGLPVPESMEGRSLVPALLGKPWDGYDAIYLTECLWQAKWGLRTDR